MTTDPGLMPPGTEARPTRTREYSRIAPGMPGAIEADVEALIGPGRVDAHDFEAPEQAVRHRAFAIAALAVARPNADHSDQAGSTVACACGQRARYAGRRPRTPITEPRGR